jgi:hypothetical protein
MNDKIKLLEKCKVCGSNDLTKVLTLNEQFLSPTFVKTNKDNKLAEIKSPLTLVLCDKEKNNKNCGLLQLREITEPDLLYKQYFYRTATNDTMRKDLNDSIADAIITRIGKGKVSRNAIIEKGGIAEYFTGLKTTPDYAAPPASKKGKIVKKLVDIGLTPEVFAEVLVDANESWQDGILDKVQDFDGAIYRDAIEDATDELIDNPQNLEKAILSAIKATKQEEIFQKLEKKAR